MGRDFWESSQAVRQLFQDASQSTGLDLTRLLFEGTIQELQSSDKTQVAVTLANVASSRVLKEQGIEAEGCAGFSLGEYCALHEAGVLDLEALFSIVKIRGELMEQAARRLDSSSGKPGMAAILGLPIEKAIPILEDLPKGHVFAANLNSPVQLVVAGTAEGLARAEELAKAAGAKRVVKLKVSGPFHTPLIAGAKVALEEALARFAFRDPLKPVYSNVTGKPITSGEEARQLCGMQLVSPVRWIDTERNLVTDGFDRFFEVGPGTVLTGLFRALDPTVACAPAGTIEDIRKIQGG